MTEKRGARAALSPSAAKIVLTAASVLGTLGGWVVLAARDAPPASATKETGEPEPLPDLLPIDSTMQRPAKAPTTQPALLPQTPRLRAVVTPPPPPVTFTRSSR